MQHTQTADQQELDRRFDALYEQYGKPLEAEHWGEFLAVSPDGQTLLGNDRTEIRVSAAQQFGAGVFLFKIGERSVGKWR